MKHIFFKVFGTKSPYSLECCHKVLRTLTSGLQTTLDLGQQSHPRAIFTHRMHNRRYPALVSMIPRYQYLTINGTHNLVVSMIPRYRYPSINDTQSLVSTIPTRMCEVLRKHDCYLSIRNPKQRNWPKKHLLLRFHWRAFQHSLQSLRVVI